MQYIIYVFISTRTFRSLRQILAYIVNKPFCSLRIFFSNTNEVFVFDHLNKDFSVYPTCKLLHISVTNETSS